MTVYLADRIECSGPVDPRCGDELHAINGRRTQLSHHTQTYWGEKGVIWYLKAAF